MDSVKFYLPMKFSFSNLLTTFFKLSHPNIIINLTIQSAILHYVHAKRLMNARAIILNLIA